MTKAQEHKAKPTWSEAVEAYLRGKTVSTSTTYRRALEDFYTWYTGTYGADPQPAMLTSIELQEWQSHLITVRHLAAATVNLRLAAVKGLARYYENRLVVNGMHRQQTPVNTLNGRDLGRLMRAIESHTWGQNWLTLRDLAMVALMANAGLRVSEVVALEINDLELKERSGWATVRRGKGLKERRVPLSANTRKALSAYLQDRPTKGTSKAIFLSKTGLPLNTQDVEDMVRSAGQRAGIDKRVTPHILRHTFATRFLAQQRKLDRASVGSALVALRDILGHKSLATTNRYLHASASEMQDMIEDM